MHVLHVGTYNEHQIGHLLYKQLVRPVQYIIAQELASAIRVVCIQVRVLLYTGITVCD